MEIAGEVEYPDGKKIKKADEFKETIKYIKSTAIIPQLAHPDKFTLDDVVGYTDNYNVYKDSKDGKDKWSADYHFDTDRIQDNKLKKAILTGKEIPGSTWGFVKTEGDTHRAQVPLHMLVHPDLVPRIKGAGVVANAISFEEQQMEVGYMVDPILEEKAKKLEMDLQAQVAANATLTEKVKALEVKLDAYKEVLIADIVANSTFDEKELKGKSFDEIEVIQNTLSKVKPQGVEPLNLGNMTASPEVKPLAERIKELNK